MLEVTIVGAAGSGKTTLANKIKTMLEAEGKSVVISSTTTPSQAAHSNGYAMS